MRNIAIILSLLLFLSASPTARAQKSSLGAKHRADVAKNPRPKAPRELRVRKRNLVYEQYGWTASPAAPPRTFKPGDLITVIVREQRTYEADADLQTRKQLTLKSELEAFIRPIDRGLGAATFRRGKPNIDYKLNQQLRNQGELGREDRLTFRLTGRLLDVKPNGQLVVEGRARVIHDEEVSDITITGICRKEDVTPDNTVLSTQLAEKVVKVDNNGALRATSSRGWFHKISDLISPY
jgi:flagellar L-ring protein FlgH